jgi:3-deoxy-D-manno-octulosonic acid (KDO) 8-phosphate synthase
MKLCNFDVGLNHPLFLIAGPCVIESEAMTLDVAGQLKEITAALNIPFILNLRLIRLIEALIKPSEVLVLMKD